MTAMIDPRRSWRALEERLEVTKDARHRRMLEGVIAHLRAETGLEVGGLLETLVADPRYHLWRDGVDVGPKGRDAVRRFYEELVASRRGVFEFVIDRVIVDDRTVVTEGTFLCCYDAALARQYGFDAPDDDGVYLAPIRSVFLWPFDDDGRLIGEDGYSSLDRSAARPLGATEVPPAYTRQVALHGTGA